jgi:hypothetical protein
MDMLSYTEWCVKIEKMAHDKDETQALDLLRKAISAVDNATMATVKWASVNNVSAVPWTELYKLRTKLIELAKVLSGAKFE